MSCFSEGSRAFASMFLEASKWIVSKPQAPACMSPKFQIRFFGFICEARFLR